MSYSDARQRPAGGAFSWTANVKDVSSNSYLTTSTDIDSLGKTRYTPVVQLTILPECSIDRSPRYVNQQLIDYNNYNVVVTPTLNLSYRDFLSFSLHEREGWARSTQTNQGSLPLTNHTSSTTATGWLRVTRSWSLAINVTYTLNTSTASARQSFTLWNASASYRFLKDQTGEIKFATLGIQGSLGANG